MMRRATSTMVLCLALTGCLPVLVGGLMYKSSKSKEQKQLFMAEFRTTNADRESKGLSPLDWCEEAYRFDKGWAYEDAACKARIIALESGKTTKL